MTQDTSPYFEIVHKGSWWRSRGNQPFLYWRRVRTLRQLAPQGTLVDVGAGEGYFASRASRVRDWNVVAIERRSDGVERTRNRISAVVCGDAFSLPVGSASATILTLWDVVEHVDDPRALFLEIRRCLKTDGIVALSTPNPDALSVRQRGTDSIQYSDPTHISILSRAEWESVLRQAGFEILRAGTDSWWDPPYFRRVPRAFWKVVAQAMFVARFDWPFRTGENLIIVARRA